MPEKLFSYGTLQNVNVQLNNFGRKLASHPGVLVGYELRECVINNSNVVNISGEAVHPIACYTANPKDELSGTVFEITDEELLQADKYEVEDYKRIKCALKSGEHAWVYVQSGLSIDTTCLQLGDIRLELFQDQHAAALCHIAQDPRIWQHHGIAFHNPEIFNAIYLAKAKRAIAHKARYMFVIYFQNQLVGSTSYYEVDLQHLRLTIGYSWLHPNYWGKGINQGVKKLLLTYAFNKLKFKRVAFCVDSTNFRSRRALEKLGIPVEGILKNHQIRPDGSSRDSAIYAITDKSWRASLS